VAGVVGAPLALLHGDVALFDLLLLVAVRLLVALLGFGVPVMVVVAVPAILVGDVLVLAVGLLLLVAVYF